MLDGSQSMENARATRDLVFGVALGLAQRAVEHFDEHGVGYVLLEETVDAGGFEWFLTAGFGSGLSFVKVAGRPQPLKSDGRPMMVTSPEEMASVMGAQSAAFDTQIPRAWIEAAARDAARLDDALDAQERMP